MGTKKRMEHFEGGYCQKGSKMLEYIYAPSPQAERKSELQRLYLLPPHFPRWARARAPGNPSPTWMTALQNSRELMKSARAGTPSQSSRRRQCQSSPGTSIFRGSDEYRALSPVASTWGPSPRTGYQRHRQYKKWKQWTINPEFLWNRDKSYYQSRYLVTKGAKTSPGNTGPWKAFIPALST